MRLRLWWLRIPPFVTIAEMKLVTLALVTILSTCAASAQIGFSESDAKRVWEGTPEGGEGRQGA